ncbi:cardiolipin synthase [Thalassoroseus pseudoceratinae]|uniref:cardiolipin synthase n=1 Tax=Thalassoroseus pseudoceratinae TaxID=2713176 RepID=UPI0014212088|nr:cardiolipin synthase [Thalassoroseus pseudoceratinae]
MWSNLFWPIIVVAMEIVLVGWATVHAVLNKRDTRAVIGWVGLVWFAPILGAVVYFCFGINRIQRKAESLDLNQSWESQVTLLPAEEIKRDRLIEEFPALVGQAKLVRNLTGHRVVPGNQVDPLIDGDQAYPEMLKAIGQAERSVSLLSYIFDDDRVGQEFAVELGKASARGVDVRVLVDDVGARYSRPTILNRLNHIEVKAMTFLPTRIPRLFKYANLRNHRKLLVVDGRIGFTGGTNIREGHQLSLSPEFPVQCLHFRIEGPVVNHLQQSFCRDWAFASGESLQGDTWFPALSRVGDVWCRGIPDGPDEDLDKMPLTLIGAISAAQKSLTVVTPYFLPNTAIFTALQAAALREVEVNILLPAKNNIALVQWATRPSLRYLLDRGCRIHLSPAPFDHTKVVIVDNVWTLIGSTNWDPRSLRLNFEFNVECYDQRLAQRIQGIVDAKIAKSHELLIEELDRDPFAMRIRDGLARLLSPYL